MIDLTPLDVRNKRGDFKKGLRGYDPQEVDTFLELAAERLEELVMDNLQLRERVEGLQRQVDSQSGREKAVQEALVTAQELRTEVKGQAQREADLVLSEAQTEARRLKAEAEAEARTLLRDTERRVEQAQDALEELERRRGRFLRSFRGLLERELDVVLVEEERAPLEDRAIDLDLGGGFLDDADGASGEAGAEGADAAPVEAAPAPELQAEEAGADVVTPEPEPEADGAAASAADEVRAALAGLESARERADSADGETLSFSFDEGPDDDPRRTG